jgi:hypothetical protein
MGSDPVVTQSHDKPVRIRCSLRYAPNPGSGPTLVGWPFAWMEITADSVTFSAGRLVPFGRPRWEVRKAAITKLERTRGGLRFFAEGFSDPWIAGSLFPERFFKKLADAGIAMPDGPIVPTGWDAI